MSDSMITKIGPFTEKLIGDLSDEMKKKETRDRIFEGLVDPLLQDLSTRYYPYFILIIVVLILIVVLLMAIMITMVIQRRKSPKAVLSGSTQ